MFIADIDFAKNLFPTFNSQNTWRDITLVVFNMDWEPFLFTKDNSFLERFPSIVETTNLIRKFNEDFNRTNVVLYSLLNHLKLAAIYNYSIISKYGCTKLTFPPSFQTRPITGSSCWYQRATYWSGFWTPICVKRLTKSFNKSTSWERITGTDIHPFFKHNTRTRFLHALAAFTTRWTTFKISDNNPHITKDGTSELQIIMVNILYD